MSCWQEIPSSLRTQPSSLSHMDFGCPILFQEPKQEVTEGVENLVTAAPVSDAVPTEDGGSDSHGPELAVAERCKPAVPLTHRQPF